MGGEKVSANVEQTKTDKQTDGRTEEHRKGHDDEHGTDDDDGGKAGDAMDVDGEDADEQEALRKKRRKFEEVMEKGNKRTVDAFGLSAQSKDVTKKEEGRSFEVAEEDDGADVDPINRVCPISKVGAG